MGDKFLHPKIHEECPTYKEKELTELDLYFVIIKPDLSVSDEKLFEMEFPRKKAIWRGKQTKAFVKWLDERK